MSTLGDSVAGHAYTILRLLDVPITRNGKSITLQLMHVRNPHMTNETWLNMQFFWTVSPRSLGSIFMGYGVEMGPVRLVNSEEWKGKWRDDDKENLGKVNFDEFRVSSKCGHHKGIWMHMVFPAAEQVRNRAYDMMWIYGTEDSNLHDVSDVMKNLGVVCYDV